ncbi:DUF2194 domain-containing protein [Streptococcus oricebi]|uniref:DUF2194 domain-containing protein n=1 Tax=Streptococcus oricebi TaxID=1547447 RepID=A0ABS5B592_9STRE|nr:DUF2194 domain-containing protein [Streptococcus oricebi]MBP2623651.1 DUF2194 domain-containing protein [Streptococcus oricebi]
MRRTKKLFRYKEPLFVLLLFLVLAGFLLVQKRGQSYAVNTDQSTYLQGPIPSTKKVLESLSKDTLVLVDSQDESSMVAKIQFEQILKDMRMGYDLVDISKAKIPNFSDYKKVVVLLSTLENFQNKHNDLVEWVSNGGSAMFGVTLFREENLASIEQKLGIENLDYVNTAVSNIFIDKNFMIGGGRSYKIDEPFNSAWKVSLLEDAKIHAWTDEEAKIPLVWERNHGQGKFVVDNIGIYDKSIRGIYAASYSLMTDATAYPVINGSTYYLDDFPSPVPAGDATFVRRDYNMSVSDFYTNVWWPDLLTLHKKYGIRHTGVVIENYEDNTSGSTNKQTDIERFKYFGNSLLANGGEIGYHGYNHQPLSLSNVDYGDVYPEYKTWKSKQAMEASLRELVRFTDSLFPKVEKSVYVPPSNVLSPEGREMIVKKFPEIKSISSNYFSGKFAYAQEFEVAEDGMIEQPRTVAGAIWDDYSTLTAFSELNMHYVNNHFLHPDDALDEERGAAQGWAKMFASLEGSVSWIETIAPNIRNLTGSEMAGAVQRYGILKVNQTNSNDEIKLKLDNFHDKAYLMLRINKGQPGKVTGAKLENLTGNLYLLEAKSANITIKLK